MTRQLPLTLLFASLALAGPAAYAPAQARRPAGGDNQENALRLQQQKIQNLQTAYDTALQYNNLTQAKEAQQQLNAAQLEYQQMLERKHSQTTPPARP
jgi:hypothetical protein